MLCQLLSLDKRYHTVNCFSFSRIDSYLNFNNIKINYTPQRTLSNDSTYKTKLNYNLFNTKSNLNSNFYLTHKYNLLNKNYNLNFIHKLYNIIYFVKNKINIVNLYSNSNLYSSMVMFKHNIISSISIGNYSNMLLLLNNLNVFNYYFKSKSLMLFNNIGLYDTVIILKDKINFIYNLNLIKYTIFSKYLITSKYTLYKYLQPNFNHTNSTQYEYNTQFFFKQRNPLIIQNKLLNINVVPAIFNTQLLQNFNKMYNKYYLNLQVNEHIKFLQTNTNILLHSIFFKNLFAPIKYNVLSNNNTTYLYKHNVRLHENILFTIFDKHII